ncbi:MAG: SUMF1/EgtB/PvdO family nonheme iron enzyme [Bacteroidales bacterium]|nr:SUMF1/EgtB/PvdO family nonheme iron enzyme [Bacteroidales bacterium]
MRGGSWNNNATNCRSANRNNNSPDNRNNNIGFRVVSPKLKRMDGFPLINRLLSRPLKRANMFV